MYIDLSSVWLWFYIVGLYVMTIVGPSEVSTFTTRNSRANPFYYVCTEYGSMYVDDDDGDDDFFLFDTYYPKYKNSASMTPRTWISTTDRSARSSLSIDQFMLLVSFFIHGGVQTLASAFRL